MSKTILAVDVGSTKISAVIAELSDDGHLEITGHGFAKSQGIKKGIIIAIKDASSSIKKAVADARRIAGNNIALATISISNAYTQSLDSVGIVNIPHKDITLKEINRAMEAALYNANIPSEYEVIHALPFSFKVDNQNHIEDPYGMNASRMEVNAHIIMAPKSSLLNVIKAARMAGLDVESVVLNGYASAIAVMNEDERQLGAAVIDMGGETSNLIIHTGHSIRYNDFIPVGSNHITNDLTMALNTPPQDAEKVKIQYGDVAHKSTEVIELPSTGDRAQRNLFSLESVYTVVTARVEELLVLLERSFVRSALQNQVGSNIILTGGMTKLQGLSELAQAVFQVKPVRIGFPRALGGLFDDELNDPASSTVVGLLLYRAGEHTQYEVDHTRRLLHGKQVDEHSEDDLTNIRLREKKSSHPKVPDDLLDGKPSKGQYSDDGAGNAEKHFSIETLAHPSQDGRNMVDRLANWLKQLF